MTCDGVVTFWILLFLVFILETDLTIGRSNELHIGGIFPIAGNGGWQGGQACMPAAKMALDDVNKEKYLLPEFKLKLHSNDSEVSKPIYKTPETAQQKECGTRNPDGIGFQITGNKDNETQYGEFPWMVALLKEEQVSNEILNIYQCGGSLITSSVVLTAAHCVANKPVNSLKVRAGEWDTQTKAELFMEQDRDLIDVIVHENFDISRLFNDIALLFVSTPFDLAENIQPICLPPHGMNFDNLRCYATGWGKDRYGKAGQYQQFLKKIDLPIVPNLQCETALRTTRLTKHFQLHESFLCAGGEIGKDTCKGDGGSPLVCPIPNTINRYYQVGIVSGGIGCGEAIPAVYASISHFRSWIDGVLAKKNISDMQFTYAQ